MAVTLLFAAAISGVSQDSYITELQHFDYDKSAALDLRELSVENRAGATIHDITYKGSGGREVPAYLIVPKDSVKSAAILWGHWLMPRSPSANRSEFLDEAIAIAPSGVVSLLIDAPQARPGFVLEHKSFGPQPSELIAEQVVDLRRGVDLLLSRSDVDPKRIGYVGHSWDARTGAILDAIDKRLGAFVFMGGPISTRDNVLTSDAPNIVAMRKVLPAGALRTFLDTYEWADAGYYATHLGPATAFFQYAVHDEFSPEAYAQRYFDMSAGSKEMKQYDADHALNEEARRDRFKFLQQHLALQSLPVATLERVPVVK
jgi:cephalosporin-C deacetylase-like acetyl esterase